MGGDERAASRRATAGTAVAACCALALLTFAPRAIVGVYQRQLLNAFDLGGDIGANWQAAQALCWGVCAPFAGMLADRLGYFHAAAIGAVLSAIAIAALGISTEPANLVFFAGALLGAGLSGFAFPLALIPAARLDAGRGAGLVAASAAFGPFVFTPMAFALLASIGWVGGVAVFAAALCGGAAVATAFARRAKPPTQSGDSAGGQPSFAALGFVVAVAGVDFAFVSQRFQRYVFDAELSANTGASLLIAFCAASVASAFAAGALSRARPGRVLATVGAARLALTLWLILAPPSRNSAFVAAALHGATWLSLWPPVAALATRWFGPEKTGFRLGPGFRLGLCVLAWQIGGLAGGWAHFRFGASLPLWWALTAMTALAIWPCAGFDGGFSSARSVLPQRRTEP